MSVMTNIVTPTLLTMIYVVIALAILWVMSRTWRKIRWWVKYKVFRREYDEDDIEFIMEAMKSNIPKIEIKKHLLIKGRPMKEVSEVMWLYDQIEKESG